jgi:hypothetical protein
MAGTLVSACDSGGSSEEETSDELIPLAEGNEWEAVTSDEGAQESTAALRIVSETEVAIQETFSGGDVERDTLVFEERSDQGVNIRYLYSRRDAPVMALRYPIEEGTTYQHTDGSGATYEVTATRETVTVPAGEYDCVLYTIRDPRDGDLVKEIWVKPGMGPVRRSDEGGEEVWELTSTNVDS